MAAEAGPAWPRDPEGAPLYPGNERNWSTSRRRAEMAGGKPYALRLDMARTMEGRAALFWRERDPFHGAAEMRDADPAAWGDVVLARKDVPASYHLAVVVDDAFQHVTDVVRGKDSNPRHRYIVCCRKFWRCRSRHYFHHRLILDAAGRKLSKSRGSETLRARRAAGESPARLIAGLGL